VLDLEMLVAGTGNSWSALVAGTGEERTAAEYGELLGKADFRLRRIVGTASPSVCLIEAELA
jgi:hypothetical protein